MPKHNGFSEEQLDVLRQALREFQSREGLNQSELGRRLGVSQQQAGRYVSAKRDVGISYGVATRIALLAGYPGVDAFLAARGHAPYLGAPADPADPYPNRQLAILISRHLDASDHAIHVVRRRSAPGLERRTVRWWLDEILRESDELRRIEDAPDRHIRRGRRSSTSPPASGLVEAPGAEPLDWPETPPVPRVRGTRRS